MREMEKEVRDGNKMKICQHYITEVKYYVTP